MLQANSATTSFAAAPQKQFLPTLADAQTNGGKFIKEESQFHSHTDRQTLGGQAN